MSALPGGSSLTEAILRIGAGLDALQEAATDGAASDCGIGELRDEVARRVDAALRIALTSTGVMTGDPPIRVEDAGAGGPGTESVLLRLYRTDPAFHALVHHVAHRLNLERDEGPWDLEPGEPDAWAVTFGGEVVAADPDRSRLEAGEDSEIHGLYLEGKVSRMSREIQLRREFMESLPLCPDHRDKVRGRGCLACREEELLLAVRMARTGTEEAWSMVEFLERVLREGQDVHGFDPRDLVPDVAWTGFEEVKAGRRDRESQVDALVETRGRRGRPGVVRGRDPEVSEREREQADCRDSFHHRWSGPVGDHYCPTCGEKWKHGARPTHEPDAGREWEVRRELSRGDYELLDALHERLLTHPWRFHKKGCPIRHGGRHNPGHGPSCNCGFWDERNALKAIFDATPTPEAGDQLDENLAYLVEYLANLAASDHGGTITPQEANLLLSALDPCTPEAGATADPEEPT